MHSWASAQVNGTWLGAGGNWSDPTLWTSKPQFPTSGGEATFISHINSTGSGTITLDTSVQLSRLTTTNTRYMQLIEPINGNTLTLVGPAEVRVDDPLVWVGGFFWPRPGFWLKGGVAGSAGLTKTGNGEMVLSETNTFTGGLRINGGTVFARNDASLGAPGASITLNGGSLSSFSNVPPLDTSRTIHIGPNGGTFHAYGSVPAFRGDMIGDSTATFQSMLLQDNSSLAFRVLGDQSFTGDIRVITRSNSASSTGTLADAGAWRHARSVNVVGRLSLDNIAVASSDRLSDGTLSLSNGTLLVHGNTGTPINEHAGALVADGFGHLAVGTTGAQPVNLTFSRVETRRGGGIAIGTLLGGSSVRFDQPPTLIGSGTHGTDSAPIAPALSVNTLHTYDSAVGARRLNASEFISTLPVGTTNANLVITSQQTATAPATVNALQLEHIILGSGTITVSSGVIAALRSGGGDIDVPVDLGSAKGIVSGRVDFNGGVHGSGGIDYINGVVTAGLTSDYTGETSITNSLFHLTNANIQPGQPGPFGADTSPVLLHEAIIGGSGTIGRDLIVRSTSGTRTRFDPSQGALNFTGDISGTGTLELESDGGTLSLAGDISGPLRLFVIHGSHVRISGDNSFSGGIQLNSALVTVTVASDTAMGVGTIQTASCSLRSEGGVRTLANPLLISAVGAATLTAGSQFVFNGPVFTDTVSNVFVQTGANVQMNGAITGGGWFRARGPGTLTLGRANTFDRALEIGTASFLRIDTAGSSATKVGSLLIAGTPAVPLGTIDLTDDRLLLLTNPIADVAAQIAFARNGGAWDRAGITSSTARANPSHNTTLGALTGMEYRSIYGSGATFDGFALSDSDVLVKYTYYGDTDFNGAINFDDYARIDAGFNNGRSGWMNGDFDLNGAINFDDYALIDLSFNSQSGTLVRAMDFLEGEDRGMRGMNTPELQMVIDHFAQFGNQYATSFLNAVPEPTSALVFAGVVAAATMRVRRRRHGARNRSYEGTRRRTTPPEK